MCALTGECRCLNQRRFPDFKAVPVLRLFLTLVLLLRQFRWVRRTAPPTRQWPRFSQKRFVQICVCWRTTCLRVASTATRGFDIAAKFMATQFEGMGLQRAGDNGTYFQNVPLRLLKAGHPAKSALVLRRGDKEEDLVFQQGLPPEHRPGAVQSARSKPRWYSSNPVGPRPSKAMTTTRESTQRARLWLSSLAHPTFLHGFEGITHPQRLKPGMLSVHGAVGVIYDFSMSSRVPSGMLSVL